jgi:hypothetical protein
MSELLLERLSKKSTPQKQKLTEIVLEKGQVQVDTLLVDKTDEKYDVKNLRQRLKKQRGLSVPEIFQPPPPESKTYSEPTKPTDTDVKIPKKLKKTVKLPGEFDEEIPEKQIKRTRKLKEIEDIVLDVPASLIELDEKPLGDRLAQKEPSVNVTVPAYYLNNREYFINFINTIFKDYGDILKQEEKTNITCDSLDKSKSKSFSLMTHQQIVRDYINVFTPYRGLLLYHGLGAGKTCASIGIAEGMKDNKQVIIMTPASLRANYISELKVCGDPIYKLNQYWEKVNTSGNPHLEKALSEILNIPVATIRKQGFAWMVNVSKPSNFKSFSPEDQKSINKQIDQMIMKKYRFMNYNGMRHSHLDRLIREASMGNSSLDDEDNSESNEINTSINPFDNKVIIIDEAHNFVSRIVNKLPKGKKINKKEKKNTPLSIRLYNYILSASNCRVIFLTGTPIINYPNEIAVLFNMLRGYIKTFYFKLDTSKSKKPVNSNFIINILKKNKLADYIEYSASKTTLIITRNPFGFVNKRKKTSSGKKIYAGVSTAQLGEKDDSVFRNSISRMLKENDIDIINSQSKVENHKVLPDSIEIFRNMFIDPQNGEMKEVNVFKKRIIGLTSYFRSASESLLPRYSGIPKVYNIPMSNYQIGIYEKARSAERKEEKRNAKKKLKQQEGIYAETTSTYRIFSRAFCNFVFPNEIVKDSSDKEHLLIRPMPKAENNIKDSGNFVIEKNTDEDILDAASVDDKLGNLDGLYSQDDVDNIQRNDRDLTDFSYKSRIEKSLQLLKLHGDKFLSVKGLSQYGPKFLQILKNLKNNDYQGLHLIYSQFRTLEGVGILSLILQHHGFSKFKISQKTGTWAIDMTDDEKSKPSFALYTGTETVEEKEIIRNIFNGNWDKIPSTLARELRERNINNNIGEIIKILMITSSGSEGITLKNTRYVHIVEPYWHPVRTDQVIGRARRICSHKDLPQELRTVDVFMYLMTFTEKQLMGDTEAETKEDREPKISQSLKISMSDRSKIDKKITFTSDETLYEISNIKKTTSDSILRAIKESSVDCALHSKSNKKEGLVCYSFGSPSVNSYSYKPNYTTEEKDSVQSKNIVGQKWTADTIKISGVKYALKRTDENNKLVGEIYDLDAYNSGSTILVGKTRINPKKPGKIQFIRNSN